MTAVYPYPLFVYPSLFCNYACSYCFTRSGADQPRTSFLIERWAEWLAAAAALGVPEIRLSGGEPLLIRDIAALCGHIAAAGMRYTIHSNGSIVERHAAWLVRTPPDTLWLSFHREHTTRARFAACVAAAAAALPCIGVNLLEPDADENLASTCVVAGARRIKILSVTDIGRQRGTGLTRRQWSVERARALGARLDREAGRAVELRIELPSRSAAAHGPTSCALRARPLLSLGPDGQAWACCVSVGVAEDAVGDLRVEPLEAIVSRLGRSDTLPCARALPAIARSEAACPLAFTSQ